MTRADDLRWLIAELERERGMGAGHAGCDDEHELFGCFRALVNTREPKPAGGEFLEVQDRVLSGMIEKAGITDAAALPCVPLDSRISLWRGDITTLRVDAVVNAANSQMLGCWVPGHHCIDNAIHTFAGVQLRLECAALMEAQGYPEPTGRAKVTDAFNLPARFIVHTVGPIANGAATATDARLLANCYESCLDAAAELGCSSIAFCCISTGVFGFPQEAAAAIAIDAVRAWLDSHDSGMHVIFNVFTDRDERIYHGLLFDATR